MTHRLYQNCRKYLTFPNQPNVRIEKFQYFYFHFIVQIKTNNKMDTLRKEDTIQAVLIADAYDKILQPFANAGNTVSVLISIEVM